MRLIGKGLLTALAGVVAFVCTGCATGLTPANPQVLSGTQARFFGDVVSNAGGDVEYWMQYGQTTAYGSETAHTTVPTEVNQPRTVVVQISGLQRSTSYHYRLCAQDSQQSGGPGCGEDKSFTTPNLECGDVITHDFTLSGSVQCEDSPPAGLVVGADGVDINLNGKALNGPSGRPPKETSGTGVENKDGYDDVTIRNGSLRQWSNAAHLVDASFNLIRNVDMSSGNSSVQIRGGESNTIRSSVMTGTTFGAGLSAIDSDGLVVADSSGTQWGIDGDGARIVRNQIGSGTQFFACLWVTGNRNRIADNRVLGCPLGSILIGAGSDTEVIGNEASDAWTYDPSAERDGIFVGAFTAGTLVQGNYVHDNDDDGIDVRGTATRLKDNRAENNGDFGIDAAAGVTDLGGNTASGNGNPLQCRNVFCQ